MISLHSIIVRGGKIIRRTLLRQDSVEVGA
jgi:hypothetical protein